MSTNKIDEMSEREAKSILNDICSELKIGGGARSRGVILTCISNASRRSDCLSRIESHLTNTVVVDGEEIEESLLLWGDNPEEYIQRYKAATE